MATTQERRRAQRFPLDLPLQVRWRENTGEVHKPGTIRDISANGIYFVVDRRLQPESKLEFYVRLQIEQAIGSDVLLHCVGSVVRVEPRGTEPNRVGVAARIDRYRFLRPGEGPADLAPEQNTQ